MLMHRLETHRLHWDATPEARFLGGGLSRYPRVTFQLRNPPKVEYSRLRNSLSRARIRLKFFSTSKRKNSAATAEEPTISEEKTKNR